MKERNIKILMIYFRTSPNKKNLRPPLVDTVDQASPRALPRLPYPSSRPWPRPPSRPSPRTPTPPRPPCPSSRPRCPTTVTATWPRRHCPRCRPPFRRASFSSCPRRRCRRHRCSPRPRRPHRRSVWRAGGKAARGSWCDPILSCPGKDNCLSWLRFVYVFIHICVTYIRIYVSGMYICIYLNNIQLSFTNGFYPFFLALYNRTERTMISTNKI